MGLFSWLGEKISDGFEWVSEKISNAVDWVKDKLGKKKYDENAVEDHVDVDAVLAGFRDKIKNDVEDLEAKCMESVSLLFADLKNITKERFPDLVEIVENEQKKAENDLKGTVMKYVKEHLSKNDAKFLRILKMNPGQEKDDELDKETEVVLNDAEREFNTKLKKYTEHILEEFTYRLNNRISDQEAQMNKRIVELEKLRKEIEIGQIDIDALKDRTKPLMESSQCIIQILDVDLI